MLAETDPGFSESLATAVLETRFEGFSPLVVERARHGILDWLACTIAGAAEDSAVIVRDLVVQEGATPVASFYGVGGKASARQAALVNGVAGHALDFDDGTPWSTAHPSVPVLSAVMAMAESMGATGAKALEAAVAGYEILVRVGCASGRSAYDRGFHATGTLGTFGAAAGCARLLDFDHQSIRYALGLAATQAAGLRTSFGTMAKHLHAGKAAENGMLAAQLAGRGFTGPMDAVEAPQGFAATHNSNPTGFRPSRLDKVMGERRGVESLIFKRYACCAATHSTIESIVDLQRRQGLEAAMVEQVTLRVPAEVRSVCPFAEPQDGTQAKFSLPYAAALALAGVGAGPDQFTDEGSQDARLRELGARTQVVWDEGLSRSSPTFVEITTRDGRTLAASIDAMAIAGDAELPYQWDALCAKFRALVTRRLGKGRADALIELVSRFETLANVGELARAAAAAREAA